MIQIKSPKHQQTCDRCCYWDYELAENVGRHFSKSRGECSYHKGCELITHCSSTCGFWQSIPDDVPEIAK